MAACFHEVLVIFKAIILEGLFYKTGDGTLLAGHGAGNLLDSLSLRPMWVGGAFFGAGVACVPFLWQDAAWRVRAERRADGDIPRR